MVKGNQLERLWREYVGGLWAHTRWWGRLLLRVFNQILSPETSLTAAAIGYYTLFSLFPLALLSVAVVSFWVDSTWAQSEMVKQLEFVAPALGEMLGNNIISIISNRGPITGFALAILLWSASNVFSVLTRAMDQIWDVNQMRPVWRYRGLAMLMALSLSSLLLFAFFAEGAILTIINSFLPDEFEQLRPYTTQIWAAFISIALFGSLYYLLPHIKLSFKKVIPGAIVAGVMWEGAKWLFLTFIETYLSRSNLVYGSVTTIMAFLTWAYVSSIIFLFGAYLNVEYLRRKEYEREQRRRAQRYIEFPDL